MTKGGFPMKDKLTLATKLLLDFMFYTGILVTLTLPISIKFYGRYNSYFANNYVPLILLFFFSGTFAILIIYELRKIFRTVLNDDCFILENVTSLRRMGTYSLVIALITAGRLFLYITPAVLIVILVFVIDVVMAQRKKGLTELAKDVDITLANLSILKNNKAKAIRLSTLNAICKSLNCQPGDILQYIEDEKEEKQE